MANKIRSTEGYLLAVAAYLLWGVLPIYWKQLTECTPYEVLSYRIIGSFIFLIFLSAMSKRKGFLNYFKEKRTRNALFMTGIIIAINWGFFIFAINTNHVLQASLGYYINPLISIFLGMLVLKEKLTRLQTCALLIALSAVIYMTISYGVFPWLSLILAFSFGLYGLLKKIYGLDSVLSLFGEMLILTPIAVIYLIYLYTQGKGILLNSTYTVNLLVVFAGVVTVIPLLLFAESAKKIALSAVGFIQYIAPTLMLIIGVLVFNEEFQKVQKISFMLIWVALLLYIITILSANKAKRTIRTKAVDDFEL